jgi:hypothetical protein
LDDDRDGWISAQNIYFDALPGEIIDLFTKLFIRMEKENLTLDFGEF